MELAIVKVDTITTMARISPMELRISLDFLREKFFKTSVIALNPFSSEISLYLVNHNYIL